MSAESPRRGLHKGAQVVSPQPIVDRSIIDSVAGIINDIVPQAYTGAPNSDNKETISWARFEYSDVNDPALYPDYNEGSSTPPLILILGYTTGVQVWLISATGEATEVLSWRQGIVRTLRILPNPKTDDDHVDLYEQKRPMVAICDSAGPGPQFCNISFVSLKTGDQTKNIKFKNPVLDVLANRRSIIVTFSEKIAVFDARTLEDVLTVTTCYPCPGPNPNPVALGMRWLAYSEKKLLPTRRSSGGCESDGVQSYTATVLYAAKSLGKGLRGLGETVASSLTGNTVSPLTINNVGGDVIQPGVVTILDLQAAKEEKELDDGNIETVIAHFTAHSDAIVAMTFDLTGALLMTADKRGHDFHVFRIQPHPGGPTLAAVHHLYILHRGDTTARVQDMTFSSDTRWAAVSTIRGTTHVFPVAPYGGPVGVRTHSTPHVVNRLSRFHRSAGLTDDGTRSHSPVSHAELPLSVYPYSNPRLPPYPHPTILHPLAQIRQPTLLNHSYNQTQASRQQPRQRLHSDDNGSLPLKICACFAPPRAWIYSQRESGSKAAKRAVDSLFIMACHGNMIQYDLEPKPAAGVPKEKVCDDTNIDLEVEVKGQWPLLRSPNASEIAPPLQTSNPLLNAISVPKNVQPFDSIEDRWLSQVEIVTHAGPHRRLWMGPQFVFKTYNAPSGVAVNLVEAEAVEIGITGGSRPARSNPVNMPHAASRPLVPVVIDGSGSSYEQSPRFMEAYGDPLDSEHLRVGSGENQLREDLAEAMLETVVAPHRAPGRRSVFERVGQPVAKVVNPLGTVITVSADEEDVSSSQEFDSAEEGLVPEPPRSVCAEEGPASLGDLEPESQTLRDLTEICAEMRSASEPAIDSVPDENICDIKERKALCVEMASVGTTAKPSTCPIDFEREGAFQDVPTSLSLCAEQGEIPSSPMTQAKESAWSGSIATNEEAQLHERNLAKAKYVVSYDEDSVVLMENNTAWAKRTKSKHAQASPSSRLPGKKQTTELADPKPIAKKFCGFEKTASRSIADPTPTASPSESKRAPAEPKTRFDDFTGKEPEDSVFVEDANQSRQLRNIGTAKMSCPVEAKPSVIGRTESKEKASEDTLQEKTVKAKTHSKFKAARSSDSAKADIEESRDVSGKRLQSKRVIEPFVQLEKLESSSKVTNTEQRRSDSVEDYQLTTENSECELLPLKPLGLDYFNNQFCYDYQIVENVHDSELISIEVLENVESTEMLIPRRKSSKSTISDDDLEYIHSSEILESSSKLNTAIEEGTSSCSNFGTKHKGGLSSDDDLEYVQCSDINKSDSETMPLLEETSGSPDICPASGQEDIKLQPETSLCDRSKIDACTKPERNSIADVEKVDREVSPSSTKKMKSRGLKGGVNISANIQKQRQTGAFEIIDIDAMQHAETESVVEVLPMSEYKVLFPRHQIASRAKKPKKSRKSAADESAQEASTEVAPSFRALKMKIAELQEAAEELHTDGKWLEPKLPVPAEVSWSTIVKKKSTSPPDSELRKELDLEPLIEVEEKTENEEANDEEVVNEETAADSSKFREKSMDLKIKSLECSSSGTEKKETDRGTSEDVDGSFLANLDSNYTPDLASKAAKPRTTKNRKRNPAESAVSNGSLQSGAKQGEEDKEEEEEEEEEVANSDCRVPGGSQSIASYEDLSSSSFSSASRASLDARSSPTPSYGAENMMVFPGDSSGSI
ncbi:uncharacterized protein [Prorops nasuta]|uniref:uncharacterized protein isoform X2 n=1 Tax=Prorops nasuta TaxID=863751 RepID=UPI0034CF8B3C